MLTDEAAATNTFGAMTAARWQELRDQLVALEIVDPEPGEAIDAVFTSRFLQAQEP